MPLLARPWIVVIAGIYLLVVLGIGAWAVRRTRSSRDYFIAGQGIGLFVTALATMSAAFSGFVFIGGPGLTYRLGLGSLFICIPVSFTAALLCWVVARRLRLLAEAYEVYTIPDALIARFGGRAAPGAAALAIVIGVVGYLGSQMLALGIVINAVFGLDRWFGGWGLPLAMFCGLLIVLAYAIAGGMVAGVYTDLFQGLLMMITALAVFLHAVHVAGGPQQIAQSISGSELFGASFLEPLGRLPVRAAFGLFFVFAIGNLGQPHMLHKFFMLDDPRKLRWMPLVIGGGQTLCVLIWLGIGLAVPALVAQGALDPLVDPDSATPLFLLEFAPQLLAGLVFAGVLSAIMSTADSFVNIGAAALTRDLPRCLGMTVRDELRAARWATALLMLASAGFALLYGDLIALLGTFAFGTFAAALAPAMAVGLNWERVTARAATASIVCGTALNLALELLRRVSGDGLLPRVELPGGAPPAALAMAASFVVLILISLVDRGSQATADPRLRAVMRS